MDSSEKALEENRRLRRTMRDLVALSTLPAIWIGMGLEGIARSLADVLLNTLSLDLVYVRLRGLDGAGVIELVRSKHGVESGSLETIRKSLEPVLEADQVESPLTIPDLLGKDTLHLAVTRFGVGDDQGVLVTGSRKREFPTEQDRVLLGVGANQAAIVVQRRRSEEQRHEQREWLRVTLASIGDAVIATDTEGRITFMNSVAGQLTGWTQDDARGNPLGAVFAILNEQTRQPVENPVEKVLREGAVVGLGNHTILLAKDGMERPIDDSAAPIRDEAGKLIGVVLIFRDVTEQRRTEQQRNARLAVIQVLTQAATTQDAAEGVLRGVGESLGWDVGFFWTLNEDRTALVCRESWQRPNASVIEFKNDSCSRTFRWGQGLPGHVWSGGKPAWILDLAKDANFPRAASAAKHGLQSAFACPIVVGEQPLGVIEFYTRSVREPDPDLLEMMATVAGAVGQFIERRQAEEKLRRSERELADFFENATIGLHWVGPDGTILRANRAELELLGYAPEEYVGHNIAEFHVDENVICDILQRLKAKEKLQDYPARMRCKDGSIKDVLIHSSVLFEEGRFVHTRCFTRDITDRKRAEEKLRQSEARFRALMEQAPFSIQVFSPDGRTMRVNRAWEELWGVRFEQIGDYNILEDRQLEAKGILHYIHQAFAGQPAHIPAIQYNPNDTIPDITKHEDPRRWLSAVIYPLKDAEGDVREVVLIHEDITARKRAEEALRENRERLDLALQASDLGLWELSLTDYTASGNLRHGQIFGYDSLLPELTYQRFMAHVVPEDQAMVDEKFRQAVASGEAWDFECRIVRTDGTLRWIWAKGRAYRDDDGQRRRMIGTVADITERKQIETDLRDTRSRLDAALEAGAIATWTWDIPNNRLFADPSLARLFNLSPLEAEGGLLDKYTQSVHPDDWPRVSAALDQSVESGEDYEADYRIVQPDGSVRWVVARGRAERDEIGRPVRMPGVLVDITERKRLEEELRLRVEELADANRRKEESLALLDTLQRNAPVGFAFVDRDFRYVRINEALAAIDGNIPEYHLGRTVEETVPKLWPKLEPLYRRVLESQQPVLNQEVTGETPAAPGQTRHWLVSYYPVFVQHEVAGIGILVTDITERKRLEDELRQQAERLADADRRKDEFLATLAHELRNPLAPIRTGLEVMKLAKDDPATVQEIRTTMERQTEQLITLVDDLLDVSRITRGKLELRKCRVNLADVVRSAVEASEPFIDEVGHELSVAVPEIPIHLDADPHRLAQVLSNLLNNAAKYTPEGGRIRLTAEQQGSDVVVSVADNGIGIPAEMLDRIFEMFAQIERPMEKGYTGLGIGLTLVKSLVEMHNGRIEVQSDGANRGSTFSVRLPILIGAPVDNLAPAQPGESVTASNKRRVLVVDDNEAAAKMLSMVVGMLGHEVRTAGDGQQGIEMAANFLPDLVLMDIGMPKMNGYEAAQQIRQQPWGEKMMLVALTGWGQDEDRQRTKEAGFDRHLVKPAEPSELERLLAELNDKPPQ